MFYVIWRPADYKTLVKSVVSYVMIYMMMMIIITRCFNIDIPALWLSRWHKTACDGQFYTLQVIVDSRKLLFCDFYGQLWNVTFLDAPVCGTKADFWPFGSVQHMNVASASLFFLFDHHWVSNRNVSSLGQFPQFVPFSILNIINMSHSVK